jgi:hypothetical protein
MLRKDPILENLQPLVDKVGYRIIGFEDRAEWPQGCAAVRIVGPYIASTGLPFPIPADNQEVWAKRWCLVLSISFMAGLAAGSSPEAAAIIEKLKDLLGTANEQPPGPQAPAGGQQKTEN